MEVPAVTAFSGKQLLGHTGSHPPFYSCIWAEPESGYGLAFCISTDGGQDFTNHYIPELFAGT